MKKHCALGVVIMVLVSGLSAQAQGFRIGGHGLYTMGGDIEDSSIGFGAQAEIGFSRYLSVELGASVFEDEASQDDVKVELEMISLAAVLKLRLPVADRFQVYGLGGASYNITDATVDLGPWEGMVTTDIDLDNGVGIVFGGGASLLLSQNIELFAEYRHNIYEIEGTTSIPELSLEETSKEDYNFGFAKIGLNLIF